MANRGQKWTSATKLTFNLRALRSIIAPMGQADDIDVAAMLDVCASAPMTHTQIARDTGLSRTYVIRLRSGERGARVSHTTVIAIKGLSDRVARARAQADERAAMTVPHGGKPVTIGTK